jgi:hypothetical protein
MVYIFTKKEKALKAVFPQDVSFLDSPLSKHSPGDGDITYFDVSGVPDDELKKTLNQLKKCCKDSLWGIIDPEGNIKDSAALFFDGACDYLGPGFLKEKDEMDSKRLKEVLVWRKNFVKTAVSEAESGAKESKSDAGGGFLKSGVKLPAVSSFSSWKKIEAGKTMSSYLLYCSLQGKIPLDSRLDEKTIAQIHKRFLSHLEDHLQESDGLLWMNTGKDCLFLIPPRAKCAEEAIKACVGMVVSAPQIVLETLAIKIPANIIFALHYGSITYKQPGKTGTVVSDAINFVFHLGAKKAEPGRLTLSGELPDVTVPKSMQDLFAAAGEFEGRKVWHTKKFSYAKPWM